MSTNSENKNYYSAIHYGMKYGIKHPLIVEYGYHVDVAGREDERTSQIVAAYKEMLEVENDSPAVKPPADEAHEEPVEAVDYEWLLRQAEQLKSIAQDIIDAFID